MTGARVAGRHQSRAETEEDLTCGPAALWLWRLPTLLIVVGAFLILALRDRVSFQPAWFLGVVLGLALLACLAERPLGRYRGTLASPDASSGLE